MLAAAHRLRSSVEFGHAVRRGRRATRGVLTVHVLRTEGQDPARAGLVVSKAVGSSVVRHRVSRRLRHLLREETAHLEVGTLVVVRAAPDAATATSAALAADLRAALSRALGR